MCSHLHAHIIFLLSSLKTSFLRSLDTFLLSLLACQLNYVYNNFMMMRTQLRVIVMMTMFMALCESGTYTFTSLHQPTMYTQPLPLWLTASDTLLLSFRFFLVKTNTHVMLNVRQKIEITCNNECKCWIRINSEYGTLALAKIFYKSS